MTTYMYVGKISQTAHPNTRAKSKAYYLSHIRKSHKEPMRLRIVKSFVKAIYTAV